MKMLTVIGTRPDAIKLLPVHFAASALGIESILCATEQHIGMLDQVLDVFCVKPDFNLGVMQAGQDLFYLTDTVLTKIKEVCLLVKPDLIMVQGDTTTAFAAALAAFYLKIPIGHVEAGLRTGSLQAPYPEEMNRRFIGMVADYHFAATSLNVANLLAEGVDRKNIILTGNTVVDALHMTIAKIKNGDLLVSSSLVGLIKNLHAVGKRIVLLTAHRRESFGGGLHNIFRAVQDVTQVVSDIAFLYPQHPNPHVQRAIDETGFAQTPHVYLLDPLSYGDLVYCLLESAWVVTDSGGIQEEAISLGKYVVVLRELTERIEGVWAGIAHLAGTDVAAIIRAMLFVHAIKQNISTSNIYGDGQASKKIASFIGAIQLGKHQVIGALNMPIQQQKPYDNINHRNPRREA